MSGTCKYCGFSGSHEAIADHAGKCEVMLEEDTPVEEDFTEEDVNINRLYGRFKTY